MVFYILLIIPHVAAIGGLLWFAYKSGEQERDNPTYGDGWDYEPEGPTGPVPAPPALGPPLPDADAPRRRRTPGEPLAPGPWRPGRRRHRPEPARVGDGEPEPAER